MNTSYKRLFLLCLSHWNLPEWAKSSAQASWPCCSSARSSSCSVLSEVERPMLKEDGLLTVTLWHFCVTLTFVVFAKKTAGCCWLTRQLRASLKPTAISTIWRLSAAVTMRVTLCLPTGSFPVYTISSRQPNSCEEATAVSIEMVSVSSSRDLKQHDVCLESKLLNIHNNSLKWPHLTLSSTLADCQTVLSNKFSLNVSNLDTDTARVCQNIGEKIYHDISSCNKKFRKTFESRKISSELSV